MSDKIPVAVLGATGSVGQRFVQLLENHPWFDVVGLTASDKKIGQVYSEACHWVLGEPIPDRVAGFKLQPSDPRKLDVRLAFSALPSAVARELEPRFARAGIVVCSNASAFRAEADVPILLPEVNPAHICLIGTQRRNRGWQGCIVTNPNCTSTGLTVVLKALSEAYVVRRVFVVSMQAISGAGYPGVPSLDIQDNVIPYISGEEEKVAQEPRKILGQIENGLVSEHLLTMSVHVNRVPVTDGHLVCASVELDEPIDVSDAAGVLTGYSPPPVSTGLPSTPDPVIQLRAETDRPQPRLDRMAGRGMTTVVGRLRPDPIFHLKFVVLSHNTIRGAAGGSIYNAELLVKEGYL